MKDKKDFVEELEQYESNIPTNPDLDILYHLTDPAVFTLAAEKNWPGVELFLDGNKSPFNPDTRTIKMKSSSDSEKELLFCVAKYFIQNNDRSSQTNLIALLNQLPLDTKKIKLLREFALEKHNQFALNVLDKSILSENNYRDLIENHLTPLTEEYFTHLNEFIAFDGKEPNYLLSEAEKDAIEDKLDIVIALHRELKTSLEKEKPSPLTQNPTKEDLNAPQENPTNTATDSKSKP